MTAHSGLQYLTHFKGAKRENILLLLYAPPHTGLFANYKTMNGNKYIKRSARKSVQPTQMTPAVSQPETFHK
jgi:hypothetical protein